MHGCPVTATAGGPQRERRSGWVTLLAAAACAAVVSFACFITVREPPQAAFRSQCKNSLKAIAIALHNCHDVWSCFPPPFVADERGRPLHSWRVLILPYFEFDDFRPLYDAYDFSEPWDGPHNLSLGDRMPPVYRCPADEPDREGAPSTSYVAIVGPHTCWSAGAHVTFADGFGRFLSEQLPQETVRRLIERDDGGKTGEF